MAAIEREGLEANVSVKLTGLGLAVDTALCAESVRAHGDAAAQNGRFVRIDMEDSSTTTATLDLYRELRAEGCDNVGIVLEAMLRRTLDDDPRPRRTRAQRSSLQGDLRRAGRPAYQGDEAIRFAFVETMAALWEGGARVAVATHDGGSSPRPARLIEERGLGRSATSSRCSLGVPRELADEARARRPHAARLRTATAASGTSTRSGASRARGRRLHRARLPPASLAVNGSPGALSRSPSCS